MSQTSTETETGPAGASPLPPHRRFVVCGGTNVGSARCENQDTFVIAELDSGRMSRPCIRTEVWVSRPGLLMLVCDGMGGPPAGDVAAELAAASIKHDLRAEGNNVWRAPSSSLNRAVLGANAAILAEADAHPKERGMGTTCTVAIAAHDRLTIAQVGDSRAYLLRDRQLRPLTRDQTVVADLIDAGRLRADQAEHSKYRDMLTQALGTDPDVHPIITSVEMCEGDRVLLCSDGLHGVVPDETIAAILSGTPEVEKVSEALIAAALDAGGPDNVTVIVAECGPLRPQAARLD